jgi:hypothetical protein
MLVLLAQPLGLGVDLLVVVGALAKTRPGEACPMWPEQRRHDEEAPKVRARVAAHQRVVDLT